MDMGMNMEVEGEGDWARGTGTTDFGHRGFGSGQWMAAIMRWFVLHTFAARAHRAETGHIRIRNPQDTHFWISLFELSEPYLKL